MSAPLARRITSLIILLALGMLALPALAQQGGLWHFKFFAGSPPQWRDHASFLPNKIACETERAQKQSQGFPVSQCYHLPDVSPKLAPTPRVEPTPRADPSPQPLQAQAGDLALQARRKRLQLQGCMTSCADTAQACTLSLPDAITCRQNEASRCLETCTSRTGQSHNDCMHQVCAQSAVNQSVWRQTCDLRIERERQTCTQTQRSCEQRCNE